MSIQKRSVMTLFSGDQDIASHRVRIVLAEKAVTVDIIPVDINSPPSDLLEMNPYTNVPTLADRDLVIYESRIIMEYLDERFPHPPLLPVYPVAKAKSRLMMFRIEQDWYSQVKRILFNNEEDANTARAELTEQLIKLTPLFADMPYFLSNDFSLLDCCIAPLLWRLPLLGIELPQRAQPVMEYANRLFDRDAFQASLTETEEEIGESYYDF